VEEAKARQIVLEVAAARDVALLAAVEQTVEAEREEVRWLKGELESQRVHMSPVKMSQTGDMIGEQNEALQKHVHRLHGDLMAAQQERRALEDSVVVAMRRVEIQVAYGAERIVVMSGRGAGMKQQVSEVREEMARRVVELEGVQRELQEALEDEKALRVEAEASLLKNTALLKAAENETQAAQLEVDIMHERTLHEVMTLEAEKNSLEHTLKREKAVWDEQAAQWEEAKGRLEQDNATQRQEKHRLEEEASRMRHDCTQLEHMVVAACEQAEAVRHKLAPRYLNAQNLEEMHAASSEESTNWEDAKGFEVEQLEGADGLDEEDLQEMDPEMLLDPLGVDPLDVSFEKRWLDTEKATGQWVDRAAETPTSASPCSTASCVKEVFDPLDASFEQWREERAWASGSQVTSASSNGTVADEDSEMLLDPLDVSFEKRWLDTEKATGKWHRAGETPALASASRSSCSAAASPRSTVSPQQMAAVVNGEEEHRLRALRVRVDALSRGMSNMLMPKSDRWSSTCPSDHSDPSQHELPL